MNNQIQLEEEILEEIKEKMDRIKDNQRKLLPTMTPPQNHREGIQLLHGKQSLNHFICELSCNFPAIRAGDYFMFENLDDKIELDFFHRRSSSVGFFDAFTDWKLGDKLTLEQVT